jgi:hypothetical protein
MLPPNCIAAMNQTIAVHPDAGYVYGDYTEYPSGCLTHTPVTVSHPNDVLAFAAGWGLYRVDAWQALGCFPEVFSRGGGDTDFRISMYEAALPHYHCGSLFYMYRVGNQQSVLGRRVRRFADVAVVYVARHPSFFAEKAVRMRYLSNSFALTIYSNVLSGSKVEALRYVLKGFRHLGAFHGDLWLWALKVLLGRKGMDLAKASKELANSSVRRIRGMKWV